MTAFIVILSLILADVTTGLLYAVLSRTFKSCVMREGAMHKLGEILAMALMYVLERTLPTLGIATNAPLVNLCAGYLALMEVGSIFENIGKLNPDIGNFLKDTLGKIRGGGNE